MSLSVSFCHQGSCLPFSVISVFPFFVYIYMSVNLILFFSLHYRTSVCSFLFVLKRYVFVSVTADLLFAYPYSRVSSLYLCRKRWWSLILDTIILICDLPSEQGGMDMIGKYFYRCKSTKIRRVTFHLLVVFWMHNKSLLSRLNYCSWPRNKVWLFCAFRLKYLSVAL